MPKPNLLAQYTPWSPSKAQLAAQCPLAFRFRYIDHAPSAPQGLAGVIGVIVHRAQELVLSKTHNLASAFEEAIKENKHELTDAEIEKVLSFSESVRGFAERIEKFKEKNRVKQILLEQKWAIDQDFTPCPFDDEKAMIRGIVDMAVVLESGIVLIIDHKTGRRRPAAYYKAQLDIYSVFALSHFPELVGVQCALHYVAPGKLDWSDTVRPQQIRGLLRPWLISYLNIRAERAQTEIARPGKHCKWCDYRDICEFRGRDVEERVEQIDARQAQD